MYAGIVRPLDGLNVGAVLQTVGSVEVVVVRAHQSHRQFPLPCLLCPVGVGLVSKVLVQACSNVEKASIGDCVLVVVAVVEGEDLPPQASATGRIVPAVLLGVEDGLRQAEPRRLSISKIGQFIFRGRHGRHSPKGLVIVSEGLGLVGRHESAVVANLVLHSLRGNGVVSVVTGIVPVVDEGVEHGACFPPVVWIWQVARCVTDTVAGVE
jgi:hypothetical protein